MRQYLRLLLVFTLLVFSVHSNATDIQLSWVLPELREDGSQIESIDKFYIYQTSDNGTTQVIEVLGASTRHILLGVQTGAHTFQISTVENGLEGASSDPVTVNVTASKPVKIMLTVELIN